MDLAEQTVVSNTAKKLLPCDWSWETWTKTLGYLELIIGLFNVVAIPVFLIELAGVKDDLVVRKDGAKGKFNNEECSYFFVYMAGCAGIGTSQITESHYSYVLGYHITLLMLHVCFTGLAIYILMAVTKKDIKHLAQGIVLKMGHLLLCLILFISQLIVLASAGYKSGIWERFFMIVGDGMFIKVLNNFLKSARDELAVAELTGRLPKLLFTILNFMSPVKIPSFKLPFLKK